MNSYGYTLSEDGDGIFYQFITAQQLIYTVYFETSTYDKYLDQYTNLLQNGFALGFFPHTQPRKQDPLIQLTIFKIINDFIRTYGNETILLYHCDFKDRKQKCRQKLFDNWTSDFDNLNDLLHEQIEVDFQGQDTQHLGLITSYSNPNLVSILEEFEKGAASLILEK